MPPVKHSGQLSGTLSPAFAKLTGLPKTLPVFTGIHDSNASLVPHLLAQEAPFTVVSTGTWFIVMAIGGAPVELDESRDTLLNVNAQGDCVPSARFMGGRERELLQSPSNASESALDKLLANEVTPAMLMPSIVPGTGPHPEATSCWIGNSIDNNVALRNSAIALYLALMTHECMKLVGSAGPTFIEGPLAHDQQFAQMLAAVSNRPVMISGGLTGTSIGATMLISAPVKPPAYEIVNLNSDRRGKLVRYAELWRRKLRTHAM